jgi:hypothetical protein
MFFRSVLRSLPRTPMLKQLKRVSASHPIYLKSIYYNFQIWKTNCSYCVQRI